MRRALLLAGLVILGGCASEPKAESATPAASATSEPADKPVNHMPADAKAAMEAGKAAGGQ